MRRPMSEKIIYTPSKVIPLASKPEAAAMDSATHSRSFAEILAEAEAVRDVVRVSPGVVPAMPGLRGSVHGALHSMAGLVLGPLPRWVMNLRGVKLRREFR